MGAKELEATAASAAEVEATDPAKAVTLYREVIFGEGGTDGESVKVKESAIDALAKLQAKSGDAQGLRAMLTELRPLFKVVPKAKTAKIVRNIIDILATVKGHDELQVELCKEQVAWAREEAHLPPPSRRAAPLHALPRHEDVPGRAQADRVARVRGEEAGR